MNRGIITVTIADDHDIYRDGICSQFDNQKRYQLLDKCRDGDALVRAVRKRQPDVVLTDLKMPNLSGVEAIEKIVKEFPHILCVALSNFDSEYLIIDAMNAGAVGYMQKGSPRSELFKAIEQVYSGEEYYCSTTSARLMKLGLHNIHPKNKAKLRLFSDMEKDIIKLICEDKIVQEIADILCISYRTVENARSRIFDKMNVSTVAGIAIYAVRHGLYFPGE